MGWPWGLASWCVPGFRGMEIDWLAETPSRVRRLHGLMLPAGSRQACRSQWISCPVRALRLSLIVAYVATTASLVDPDYPRTWMRKTTRLMTVPLIRLSLQVACEQAGPTLGGFLSNRSNQLCAWIASALCLGSLLFVPLIRPGMHLAWQCLSTSSHLCIRCTGSLLPAGSPQDASWPKSAALG